jgi:membrane associated rhomboid family serine protease
MEDLSPQPTQTPVCYRHPDRATRLSCSECERPICADCSHDSAVGQRCPECAKSKGRHKVVDARRTTGAMAGLTNSPVSQAILGVTVAVFVIGALNLDAQEWLLRNLSSWNLGIAIGEWWRLFTSALLHDFSFIFHIGFNMYFLYLLGPALERQIGSVPFAALYVATAATGGVAAYYLGERGTVSIGASGAIFGIVAVWVYAAYRSGHRGARMMANQQMLWLIAIGIVFPFLASGLNISWQGHLGGMLGGLAIGWAWGQTVPRSNNPKLIRTVIAVTVLAASVAAVLVIDPSWL